MSNKPVFHDLTQEQQDEDVCFIIEVETHMYEVKWSDAIDDFILICDNDIVENCTGLVRVFVALAYKISGWH